VYYVVAASHEAWEGSVDVFQGCWEYCARENAFLYSDQSLRLQVGCELKPCAVVGYVVGY